MLEHRLGLGGMAVVHLARDTALDRPVAVKFLAEHLDGDRELRERFLREARYAAKLSHPNVVAIYDTGEEDGLPYIVMEYVDGVTLADELGRRGSLPPAEVAAVGRQACAGIAHAHEAGLVHRDIKPQNLLLRDDRTLKVADFGIARGGLGTTLTHAGTLLGTAAFMAPEVARGEQATVAADLYSLGAVLYELLTGVPARTVNTLTDLLDEQPILRPVELVSDAPPELERAIMRCLERDPSRRPPTAAALAAELDGAAAEAPTRPLLETMSRRPTVQLGRPTRDDPRYVTRSRAPLWAALAIGAIVLLMVLAVRSGDEPSAPAQVEQIPAGSTPAEQARNLSNWLRDNSG